MSCLGNQYNPRPTKEWYRFENSCVYDTITTNGKVVYVPLLKQYISSDALAYEVSVLKKGNILQYKKNSANITKSQRYAQIAKGAWTNRTTTWGTQSVSYTNPNINSLKRVNYLNIPVNPSNEVTSSSTTYNVTSADGVLCAPSTAASQNSFVPTNNSSGDSNQPTMPPEKGVTPASNNPIIPSIVSPAPITLVQIADGGNLICNISENICTGQVYKTTTSLNCNPLSASDVPGPTLSSFCYNSALPTYYPKTKLTYGTSGNKWPTGAKLILPA
jgi:hypothetical protein